jgi:hypothetical protein
MALPVTSAEMRAKQVPQGAVDPNVKIPQSVLNAGKRSEAIQHAIAGTAEPSVATQVENGQPQDGQDLPSQDNQPASNGQDHQPAQGELPLQQPAEDDASWERKFKSLQGRYEGEARRSRDAITQLSQRLEQMEQERNQLRNSQPVQEERPAPNVLSEQEIADYGPEFVDVMRRVATESAERAAGPLNEEINRLRQAMGYVQQETGNAFINRMNTTIGAVIPNWAELNKDARFIQWSQLPDVFSGAIRKTLMQDAWNSGDPHRVAAFFQAYLAEEAATNPQGGNGQRTPPPSRMVVSDSPGGPPTPGAPLDLSSLAAPGRAHSAASNPAEKPVYTAAEITKFYTDVAAGRWRGREAQQQAVDHDIILAQREGRILTDNRTQLPRDPYMR